MSKYRDGGVGDYAAFFIGKTARKLTHSPFFVADDLEDLKQELTLAYLLAWPKFDPDVGDERSFIKTVVNNRANDIIREAEAQKNWSGDRPVSLANPVGDVDNVAELLELIANEQAIWGEQFASESHAAIERNMDIQKVLDELPKELLQTYRLMEGHDSISSAARAAGLTRTTLSTRFNKLLNYLKRKALQK